MFSVVMVTYNQEAFVGEALRAIFSQTYKGHFEVVVSDDASDDDTQSVVKELLADAPENISIRFLSSRRRVGALRNFGRALRSTTGSYIVVADGDDISSPSRLDVLAGHIAKGSESLYVSQVREFSSDSDSIPARKLKSSRIGVQSVFTRAGRVAALPILGAGFAFDACLVQRRHPIDSAYVTNHNADHAIFWRAIARNGCRVIPESLVQYRRHAGGISLRRHEESARDMGDWSLAFHLYLKRNCNALGNLLYAAEEFADSGHLEVSNMFLFNAVSLAQSIVHALEAVLSESKKCNSAPPDRFVSLDVMVGWAQKAVSKLRNAVLEGRRIRSSFSQCDVLMWIAVSEGGVMATGWPLHIARFIPKCTELSAFAYLRTLRNLRTEVAALERQKSPPFVIDAIASRRALVPRVVDDQVFYRGTRFPVGLEALCRLPKRDFAIAVADIFGQDVDGELFASVNTELIRGRVGKKRAIRLLADGRQRVIRTRILSVSDRLKIILFI